MPFYEFQCQSCQETFDKKLPLDDRNNPQDCPSCGFSDTKRLVSLCGFNLVGDGWPGKNIRIKNQMKKKNERLNRKQNERKRDEPIVSLAPNVDGERVDSWSDAQKLAKSKGKNTDSYEPMIRKEKLEG
jgi:putative FmdB family regulatory protein